MISCVSRIILVIHLLFYPHDIFYLPLSQTLHQRKPLSFLLSTSMCFTFKFNSLQSIINGVNFYGSFSIFPCEYMLLLMGSMDCQFWTSLLSQTEIHDHYSWLKFQTKKIYIYIYLRNNNISLVWLYVYK